MFNPQGVGISTKVPLSLPAECSDGRLHANPFTFCRVSTDDFKGRIVAYVGEGELTIDPMTTFGGYGVAQVLHIYENGYKHLVGINPSLVASAIKEALLKYLGWDIYDHK